MERAKIVTEGRPSDETIGARLEALLELLESKGAITAADRRSIRDERGGRP